MSKHAHDSYSFQHYKSSKQFTLIHIDVWRPSNVTTITVIRWFVTFIDDHIRLTWVCLMKEKSEVSKCFKNFHSMIITQFKIRIQMLRMDNGCEYFNAVLKEFFAHEGIIHKSLCVDTP